MRNSGGGKLQKRGQLLGELEKCCAELQLLDEAWMQQGRSRSASVTKRERRFSFTRERRLSVSSEGVLTWSGHKARCLEAHTDWEREEISAEQLMMRIVKAERDANTDETNKLQEELQNTVTRIKACRERFMEDFEKVKAIWQEKCKGEDQGELSPAQVGH